MTREPFRVAVWGPGGVGSACIKDLAVMPETELVGVFAYSEAKAGKDAGELAGIDRLGVPVTLDRDEFLALDADVVLFCARDHGMFENDPDLLALLESGKNVITMLPYGHPGRRDADTEVRYRKACEKGNATFHAAGVDPNFVSERLVPLITGMSNHIEQITLQEGAVVGGQLAHLDLDGLAIMGFGVPPESFDDIPHRKVWPANYFEPSMRHLGEMLHRPIDRIERAASLQVTDSDIKFVHATVAAGTVAAIAHSWTGYCGDDPFLRFEAAWSLTSDFIPEWAQGREDAWVISVEGRPSVRVTLDVCASLKRGLKRYPGDPTSPSWYFTSVPMIQAIPYVVNAPAGIYVSPAPDTHWKSDLRL